MDDEMDHAAEPGAGVLFLVTLNGPASRSEVVAGLGGVRDALLRAVLHGPRDAVPDDLDGRLASLGDPAAWAVHGRGDGEPFWHWWTGFEQGSMSAQRISVPLATGPHAAPGAAEGASRAKRAAASLAACAAELRAMAGTGGTPARRALFE